MRRRLYHAARWSVHRPMGPHGAGSPVAVAAMSTSGALGARPREPPTILGRDMFAPACALDALGHRRPTAACHSQSSALAASLTS